MPKQHRGGKWAQHERKGWLRLKNKFLLTCTLCLICLALIGACKPQTPSPPISTPEPAIDYGELTEAELASLINMNIIEIETTAKAASAAITSAISDSVMTGEEVSETLAHARALQSALDFTDELVDIYTDQYSEISPKTRSLLIAIDEALSETATHSNEVVALLDQEGGIASARMDQLRMAALLLATQSTSIQTQSRNWLANVQTQIEVREKFYASTQSQPGQVAYNRIEAFIQAHDFLDAFTTALSDEKISPDELASISQLAANAKASLYNTGDPQLMIIAKQINELTHNASRGEWVQASRSLSDLEFLLPARPRK